MLGNLKMVIFMERENIYGRMNDMREDGATLKWMGLEHLNGMMEENIWGSINKG
jgi:hypothetical protein